MNKTISPPNILDVLVKKLKGKFRPFLYKEKKEYGWASPTDETREQVRRGAILRLRRKKYVPRYVLVGDVNRHLGVCDDCTLCGLKDIEAVAYLDDLFGE